MLTLAARSHIHPSSHRLICSLLFKPSVSPNPRQYYHREQPTSQTDLNQIVIGLYSSRLTHQPHEPTLHWNSRFRPQNQSIEIEEHDQSSINWDSWIQHQSPRILPFSQRDNSFSDDQLYFLDFPLSTTMPKRSREHTSTVDLPNKREKHTPRKCYITLNFVDKTNSL